MPLRSGDVGGRVVVRHLLPDGRATDVLGVLLGLDAAQLAVRRADGEVVAVAVEAVVAARRVPPAPLPRGPRRRPEGAAWPGSGPGVDEVALGVEHAARRSALGWAAHSVVTVGDWQLRASPGRVLRGRSVLAVGDPGPLGAALAAVIAHGASTGQPPMVQVSSALEGAADDDDGGRAAALEQELAARGWVPDAWVVLALAPVGLAGGSGPTNEPTNGPTDGLVVELAEAPSPAWLASTDRHGSPLDPDDLPPPRHGVAVVHASARGADGEVVAVARGALAQGWLGLSCVHVRPPARRRGAALALTAALARWAAAHGAGTAYVQVAADRAPARALWQRAGFSDHSRYRYWRPGE